MPKRFRKKDEKGTVCNCQGRAWESTAPDWSVSILQTRVTQAMSKDGNGLEGFEGDGTTQPIDQCNVCQAHRRANSRYAR
eukprot:s35_g23.t1